MLSMSSVIFLLVLVARSKLVPDFALTIHFVHLLVTSFYTRSFPSNYLWWALQIASAGLMITLGVWTCQWRELQPMAFGGSGNTAGKGASSSRGGASGQSRGGDGVGAAIRNMLGRTPDVERGDYEMLEIEERERGDV